MEPGCRASNRLKPDGSLKIDLIGYHKEGELTAGEVILDPVRSGYPLRKRTALVPI